MYLEHYGLKEPPFSITPDPRFDEVLAGLSEALETAGGRAAEDEQQPPSSRNRQIAAKKADPAIEEDRENRPADD